MKLFLNKVKGSTALFTTPLLVLLQNKCNPLLNLGGNIPGTQAQ